jgi:hypothetical protein
MLSAHLNKTHSGSCKEGQSPEQKEVSSAILEIETKFSGEAVSSFAWGSQEKLPERTKT